MDAAHWCSLSYYENVIDWEKSRHFHHCFSSEMTSEKPEKKFYTDVVLSSASDWS